MNKITVFVLAVCVLNILVYYLNPQPGSLTLDSESGLREPWRLLSYQFQHVSLNHLVENIMGLCLVGFIAREADIAYTEFLQVYLMSVFVVLPFVFFVFPGDVVAGNSSGIYGLLSFSLVRERRIIPLYFSLPVFAVVMFISPLLSVFSAGVLVMRQLQSSIYHFIGFLSGVGSCYIFGRRSSKRVLREV